MGASTGGTTGAGARMGTGATGPSGTTGAGATPSAGATNGTGASAGAGTRMGAGGVSSFGGRRGMGATAGVGGTGGFAGKAAGGSSVTGGAPATGGTGGNFDSPDFGGAAGADEQGRLRVGGVAQKGAFERGASVLALELDDALGQTGRTFAAQVTDDLGRFVVDVNSTAGSYVELTANGFYYDEVTDEDSSSQLGLRALSHLRDRAIVNVNALTELEAPRVAYLVSHGRAFDDAKAQAQSAVLAAFGIMAPGLPPSEQLDETGSSAGDAALLAISTLLQGYLSVSEVSELISVIAQDLQLDGTLNDSGAGQTLMNAAALVSPALVRKRMTARYAALGFSVNLGNFESYVQHFRDTAAYPLVSRIDFPAQGNYGPNVLALSDGILSGDYSLAAVTPAKEPVRFRMTWTGDPSMAGVWYISDILNVVATTFDFSTGVQDFTVVNPGSPSDVHLSFRAGRAGAARLDVYEGDAQVITLSRDLTWGQ